jgi:hypothetical protein
MISAMRTFLEADPPPKQVAYSFAHTTLWDNAVAACESEEARAAAEDSIAVELRIDPDNGEAALRTGLWRMLALQECERRGIDATAAECRQTVADFRLRHGLTRAAEFQRWLADNRLDQASFNRLMADEVRLDKLAAALAPAGAPYSFDDLRLRGRYAAMAARADDKERSLAAVIPEASRPDETAVLAAMVWYFEDRRGREMPSDIEAYARSAGYVDAAAFRRAVWREHLYCRLVESRRTRRGAAG